MSTRREHLVRCRRELARYARSLMPTPEDASDLLQEVGVVVLASNEAPTDAREFISWCRGIAHNLALHHWRAARRRNDALTGLGSAYDSGETPVTSLETILADRESLAMCLQSLDEPSRQLLKLKYIDGKTSTEIAQILGQSPEAVRMRIMRLREAIRLRFWPPDAPSEDQRLTDSGAH
ncbi:MAG TPA: sigma-70 family RNA polymerase sigma factor [Polyangia bacterium]|nr:sigma-70 family RNA polymerase sigma factor [Polyangia bacterium]